MLDVCYEYAQSRNISFNCSKTKIMMFKTKFLKLNFVPKIQLGNCVIDYVEKVKSLGFLLTCDLRDDTDMYRQLRYVYRTANKLRSKFSDLSKNVKNYLFRTFMYIFYGSSIWSSLSTIYLSPSTGKLQLCLHDIIQLASSTKYIFDSCTEQYMYFSSIDSKIRCLLYGSMCKFL